MPSLSDEIYRRLRDEIVDGIFPEGEASRAVSSRQIRHFTNPGQKRVAATRRRRGPLNPTKPRGTDTQLG